MTRAEIKNALQQKLNSPNWERVKNSIIGKELIAFGTEVISQSVNVQQSLLNAFDYRTTDKRGLLALSHVSEVGISFTKPSYIKVQLSSNTKVYSPFKLKYVLGNTVFYNTETVDATYEVILYQGYLNFMGDDDNDIRSLYAYDTRVEKAQTVIPKTETQSDNFFVLGDAEPDSVLFYVKDDKIIYTVDKCNAFNHSASKVLYKPYNLYDGKLALQTGDGVWAASLPESSKVGIFWLKPDTTQVNPVINADVTIEADSAQVHATILEYVQGASDNIEYARQYFYRQNLQRQAVISKEQLKLWMNAHVDVLDSSVVTDGGNVTVYVKPADINGTEAYYEKYMADLRMIGDLFINYSVLKGVAVETKLVITTSEEVPDSKKSIVESYINDNFSYANMQFDSILDTAAINNILRANGIKGIASIKGSEYIAADSDGAFTLSFAPTRGTVQFFNSSGVLMAWDSNSSIYGIESSPVQTAPLSLLTANLLGDYIVMSQSGVFLSVYNSTGGIYGIQFNGMNLPNTAGSIWTSNGSTIVKQQDTFNVVKESVLNPDAINNIPFYMTSRSVGVIESSYTLQRTTELVVDGIYIYKAQLQDSILQVGIYSGAVDTPDYTRSINTLGTHIIGSFLYKNDLYLFDTSAAFLFRNFRNYNPYINTVTVTITQGNTTINDAIESIHVFKDMDFVILTKGADRKILTGSLIRVAEGILEFTVSASTTISDTKGTSLVYRNSVCVFYVNSNSSNNKVYSINHSSQGLTTLQEIVTNVDVYNQKLNPFGSINYTTGELLAPVVNSAKAEYKALYATPTETSYIKFSGDITWILQE